MVYRKLFTTEERPKRSKKLFMDNLEAETIRQFSKLASLRSKTLFPTTKNITISFTFGNWALPYLKLLKKIGIAK